MRQMNLEHIPASVQKTLEDQRAPMSVYVIHVKMEVRVLTRKKVSPVNASRDFQELSVR